MKADTWMPLYIADYLKDTMGLTTLEHGAYLLLIMACWSSGGRLPARPSALASITKLSLSEWSEVGPVILPYFKIEDGELTHKRVSAEHARAQELSSKRRDAGFKGAESRWQNGKPMANALAKPMANQLANEKQEGWQNDAPARVARPSPSPPSEEGLDANASFVSTPKRKQRDYPEAFERAWKLYPHARGRSSKPDSLREWKALPDEERESLEPAIERFRPKVTAAHGDRGAPAFERWLKRCLHLNYAAENNVVVLQLPTRFNGPPELREMILRESDEDFVQNYIDPATYDYSARTITTRTNYARRQIQERVGYVLDRCKVSLAEPSTAERLAL